MNNKGRGELFSFLVRENINMVVFDDKTKLVSPPRERGKLLKKSPCEGMSLAGIG